MFECRAGNFGTRPVILADDHMIPAVDRTKSATARLQ
jgi:hypothetical protein